MRSLVKKNIVCLLLVIVCSILYTNAFAESIEKIDSAKFKDDTTYLVKKYVELENLEAYMDEKTSFWEIYGNGIIAFFTVLLSTGGAYFIAKKQVYENSKSIQLQVRANNISSARIKWVNELRSSMSKFILLCADLKRNSEFLSDYKDESGRFNLEDIQDQETRTIANQEFDKLYLNYSEAEKSYNLIRLYLNPKEKLHTEFIEKVDSFLQQVIEQFLSDGKSKSFKEKNMSEYQLEVLAQEILKDAWEQAKTETGYYNTKADT